MTNCRVANIADVVQVVDVHVAAFPGFFLTTLGPVFLKVMYRTFLLNPGGIFLVAEEDGRVQGFAVGALKSAGKDRHLATRFLPQLFLAVLPAVIRNPRTVLKRLFSRFFSVGSEPDIPVGAAMLRSIGVQPLMKGSGIAGKLLEQFELLASQKGARSVALTTDAEDNERAVAFYLKHGYTVAREFKQDRTRKMLMLVKDLGILNGRQV